MSKNKKNKKTNKENKVLKAIGSTIKFIWNEIVKPIYLKAIPLIIMVILYLVMNAAGFCDSNTKMCKFPFEFDASITNVINSMKP